jgi:hypothetical protein
VNEANLHRDRRISSKGGRTGWTPERRAAQRARFEQVRAATAARGLYRSMAKEREARQRTRRKLRAAWTPARRAAQAERAKRIPPESRRAAGFKRKGPMPTRAREKIRAWWTPERRREEGARTLRRNRASPAQP